MMDKTDLFEFYEILALILPGAVLLFGISKLAPQLMLFSLTNDFSAGEFGVFILIAYALGHVIQVLGAGIEYIFRQLRGEPTEWIKPGKKQLVFIAQLPELEEKISKCLGVPRNDFHIDRLTRREWLTMIKHMQIAVESVGRTSRLDKFQAIYMMCRGLIAALLILFIFSAFTLTTTYWYIPYLLLSFAFILLYRMTRFERASVRELFIQFIQLPTKENK